MEEKEKAEAAAAGGKGGGGGGCGCKGSRSCLLCEAAPPSQIRENFVYHPLTGFSVGEELLEFAGWAFPFPGVFLLEDFVSPDEECKMVELMDQSAWKPSQSGRRKQDYGPKVNFKKRKLKAGGFTGLPSFSQELVRRMKGHSILEGFSPIEQCHLDYGPERGAAIDPHLDDWWLWGEHLVSLNLLSATVLSMSYDSEESLQLFSTCLQQTPTSELPTVSQDYHLNGFAPTERPGSADGHGTAVSPPTRSVPSKEATVTIHLPPRSLVVLYGPARNRWKHAIHRNHITSRRICVTF
ncbi:alpha-ketoglutarate-dependent dioxygenase alkB homolog 4 [Hemicordylus capensis]|uniref:alpha-ketoglutarate-dependent dioxygenase alkB homolog 4 n=1 Tax=Hemicordylus capensis TaxID=884348 RepID=UPI002303EFCB|nr:alpha-ketoglutarate-dependent dioxygenase alkB homolog 4 [Hemicordylus capensis]